MSDIEDWEKLADEDDDKLEEMLRAQNKFADEQAAPVESKPEPAQQPAPQKKKPKIGEKFDKKQTEIRRDTDPVQAKLEARRMEEEADHRLTDDLFHAEKIEIINSEQDYLDYAAEVSGMLSKGRSNYRLPAFFKELFKVAGTIMTTDQLSETIRMLNTVHAEKLKAERGPVKGSKKKGKTLKGVDKRGGLMGINDDEDAQDQYDEYADFL